MPAAAPEGHTGCEVTHFCHPAGGDSQPRAALGKGRVGAKDLPGPHKPLRAALTPRAPGEPGVSCSHCGKTSVKSGPVQAWALPEPPQTLRGGFAKWQHQGVGTEPGNPKTAARVGFDQTAPREKWEQSQGTPKQPYKWGLIKWQHPRKWGMDPGNPKTILGEAQGTFSIRHKWEL